MPGSEVSEKCRAFLGMLSFQVSLVTSAHPKHVSTSKPRIPHLSPKCHVSILWLISGDFCYHRTNKIQQEKRQLLWWNGLMETGWQLTSKVRALMCTCLCDFGDSVKYYRGAFARPYWWNLDKCHGVLWASKPLSIAWQVWPTCLRLTCLGVGCGWSPQHFVLTSAPLAMCQSVFLLLLEPGSPESGSGTLWEWTWTLPRLAYGRVQMRLRDLRRVGGLLQVRL